MRRTVLALAVVCVVAGLGVAGYAAVFRGSAGPVRPSPGGSGSAAGSPVPPSSSAPVHPDACPDVVLNRLDLNGRVGQLLMIGTPIANPAGLADTVRRYRLGGGVPGGGSGPAAAAPRQGVGGPQGAAGRAVRGR